MDPSHTISFIQIQPAFYKNDPIMKTIPTMTGEAQVAEKRGCFIP
jgi:hypothetical protein